MLHSHIEINKSVTDLLSQILKYYLHDKMNVSPACMYVHCVCLVPEETRRGLWIPLELELRMLVSYHGGAGIKPLKGQQMLLTSKPPLQSQTSISCGIGALRLKTPKAQKKPSLLQSDLMFSVAI